MKTFLLLICLLIPSKCFAENVLVLGDSLTPYIGQGIKEKFPKTSIVYKVSSGLVNKKFYNWYEKIDTLDVKSFDKIVIVLGTNDIGYSNYKKYVENFITFLQAKTKAEIYWVSVPYMRNVSLDKKVQATNFDIEWMCLRYKITFVDVYSITKTKIWDMSTRTKDGVHLTVLGGKQIATEILKEMQ